MRKYESYWMSNSGWYEIKNGVRIIKEDAPPEAQESFNHYLEQKGISKEQLMEVINTPIEINE